MSTSFISSCLNEARESGWCWTSGNGFNVLVTPFYKPLAVCSGKVLAFIKYNISVLSECYGNPPVLERLLELP